MYKKLANEKLKLKIKNYVTYDIEYFSFDNFTLRLLFSWYMLQTI